MQSQDAESKNRPPSRPTRPRGGRWLVAGAALATLSVVIAASDPLAARQAPTPTPITIDLPIGGTRTPTPQPTAAPPTAAQATTATAEPDDTVLGFEADDWEGGLYRGSGEFYGRAWVAIYGAQSPYPRASLAFVLAEEPDEDDVTLTVAGLDDEFAGKNPIAIEVNGRRGYEGDSPWVSFDGVFPGDNARWTEIEIGIPAELLRDGENEIAVLNLSPSAKVGEPPYVLVAEARVETDGIAVSQADDEATTTPAAETPSAGAAAVLTIFPDEDDDDDDGEGDDDGDD